jgi:aspartate aminotransferase-like enzyme
MLPGPTNVSERVMKAMLRPVINHRGDSFRELYRGVAEKTRHLFQTEGDVVLLSSSGTGGVEAAVWNVVRNGDVVIVPVFGEFSERLAETVELAGGKAVRVECEPGGVPRLEELKAAFEGQAGVNSLFIVHNETSTGVAVPYLEEAVKLAREAGALVVVDAISSLGGYSIPTDRLGIDVCVTGSQKCIAAPPGIALLSVSERVVQLVKKSPPRTRYFDIGRYLEYAARGETPFTPALPLFYALDEALGELLEEGLANRVTRHERMSSMLYDGIKSLGLKQVAETEVRSRTVVAAYYPEGVDDREFRNTMSREHGVVVAGGFGPFAGRVFRVGCMGLIKEEYVERTLDAAWKTLQRLAR